MMISIMMHNNIVRIFSKLICIIIIIRIMLIAYNMHNIIIIIISVVI